MTDMARAHRSIDLKTFKYQLRNMKQWRRNRPE